MPSIAAVVKNIYSNAAKVLNYGAEDGRGIFTKIFKGGDPLFAGLEVGQNAGTLVGGAAGGVAGAYRHRDEGFWGATKGAIIGAGIGSTVGQHTGGAITGFKALRGLGRNSAGELTKLGGGATKLGAWDFTKTLVGSEVSFDYIRNFGRARALWGKLPTTRFGSALNTRLTERFGSGLARHSLRALQMVGASTAVGATVGGVYGAYHGNTWRGVQAGALAGASLGAGVTGRKTFRRLRTPGLLDSVRADMKV